MRVPRSALVAGVVAVLTAGPAERFAPAQEPFPPVEVVAPPRPASPAVRLAPVPGGYEITLSRAAADTLRDALEKNADEKQIAAALKESANQRRAGGAEADAQSAAKLDLLAFVVSTQLPGFKAALRDKTGPNGAVIRVTGIQRPDAPIVQFRRPRPRLERAAEMARGVLPAVLPDDAKEAYEGLRAMARTTPLLWTVTPRE